MKLMGLQDWFMRLPLISQWAGHHATQAEVIARKSALKRDQAARRERSVSTVTTSGSERTRGDETPTLEWRKAKRADPSTTEDEPQTTEQHIDRYV